MATAKVNQREIHAAYQELYDLLNEAYWAASTIEAKDMIHGVAEAVFDILTDLNREDIKSRTQEFCAVADRAKATNAKLQKVRAQIQSLIHKVELAVKVGGAIDKALNLATKFFGA